MNENKIKRAFDEIEPEAGAQERIYANILKKAAAQQKNIPAEQTAADKKEGTVQKHRSIPAWRRWGSLAACLAIVIAVGFALPHLSDRSEQDNPPVLGGSPFEDVDGADGFEKLGFTIDAPENAENIQYCIVDGEIARVRFSVGDHKYTYEAAKLDGNFSCADGDAVGSISLSAKYDAVLDRLSPDTWRAHWNSDDISYYLSNFDGASEEDITAVTQTLIAASSCK